MRRIVNGILIIFATAVTVAVLFALSNILQNLWGQTVVVATPMEAEDASNTFKESAIAFVFMALPFLGMMWALDHGHGTASLNGVALLITHKLCTNLQQLVHDFVDNPIGQVYYETPHAL